MQDALERLRANRFMRSAAEVSAFEAALEVVAARRDLGLLPDLHLVLTDECGHHEVMFGLVHLLESFEVDAQVHAFLTALPRLVQQAPTWAGVLQRRILNDEAGRASCLRLFAAARLESRVAAGGVLAAIAARDDDPLRGGATSALRAIGSTSDQLL
jgi:hypothetical protein